MIVLSPITAALIVVAALIGAVAKFAPRPQSASGSNPSRRISSPSASTVIETPARQSLRPSLQTKLISTAKVPMLSSTPKAVPVGESDEVEHEDLDGDFIELERPEAPKATLRETPSSRRRPSPPPEQSSLFAIEEEADAPTAPQAKHGDEHRGPSIVIGDVELQSEDGGPEAAAAPAMDEMNATPPEPPPTSSMRSEPVHVPRELLHSEDSEDDSGFFTWGTAAEDEVTLPHGQDALAVYNPADEWTSMVSATLRDLTEDRRKILILDLVADEHSNAKAILERAFKVDVPMRVPIVKAIRDFEFPEARSVLVWALNGSPAEKNIAIEALARFGYLSDLDDVLNDPDARFAFFAAKCVFAHAGQIDRRKYLENRVDSKRVADILDQLELMD